LIEFASDAERLQKARVSPDLVRQDALAALRVRVLKD
jgi:hypothetical protein